MTTVFSQIEKKINTYLKYEYNHHRDGFELQSLFNVILLKNFPGTNLVKGRKFEQVDLDYELGHIIFYFKGSYDYFGEKRRKSCCIRFDELE